MLQTSLLLMKNLNKIETVIFYLLCVLCSKRLSLILLFYYIAAGVSAVWRP